MPVKTMCVLNVANTTLSFLFAKIIMCFVNIVKNSLCYSQNQILYKIVCIPQHINHMNNETRITMLPSNHYDDRFNSIQNLILNPLHDSRFFFFCYFISLSIAHLFTLLSKNRKKIGS